MFREIYRKLFDRAVVRAAIDPASPAADRLPVLEPEIEQAQLINITRTLAGPYFVELDYRFRLTDANGDIIARWRVRGIGEYKPGVPNDAPRAGSEPGLEAVARAMEDAARRFGASSADDPALARWSKGESGTGAEAPITLQEAVPNFGLRPPSRLEAEGTFSPTVRWGKSA